MANYYSTTLLSLFPGSGSQNPTTNESSSSINGLGQLDLNQRVAELRKSSVATTNGVWVRNHSSALLGHDDEANVIENVMKPQFVHAASSPPPPSQPNKDISSTLISAKIRDVMKPYHLGYSLGTIPPFSPYPLMPAYLFHNNPAPNDKDDGDDDEIDGDGRIRSIPYKKNGPYTCSKCKQVFPTSQFFASHVVSSHYKYETELQRRKRLNTRIRRRNLRIQKVNDELTLVPVSSEVARNSFTTTFGQTEQVNVKHDVDHRGHDQVPPLAKEVAGGNGFTRVNIKFEPNA